MRPQHFPSGAHTIGESIERFLSPRRAAIDTSVAKTPTAVAIAARRASQDSPKPGCRVALEKGRLGMQTVSVEQLGDEIAGLCASRCRDRTPPRSDPRVRRP